MDNNWDENLGRLKELEKHICFHQRLDKRQYNCLQEAYEWIDMTTEKYGKYKKICLDYSKKYNVKETANKFPFVTSLLLIYTAIYRYNDENSNGFWPEFFGSENNYNFYKDVKPVMKVFQNIVEKYNINSTDRHYLSKVNLSEIFSQVYIPEISLKKIYSSIYSYYYKNSNGSRVYNLYEFLETNGYKLDSAGFFFLSEDKIIDDVFGKIIDMFEEGLYSQNNIDNVNIPQYFINTFHSWLDKDKQDIDSKNEEYYIEHPKIKLDILNERIKLILPQQKSRVYSDEQCGWKLIYNNKFKFIQARIIKQHTGVYLILDEEMNLEYFNKLDIEYIFNNKVVKNWQFNNNLSYLVFDESGKLLKNNKVSRTSCIIGTNNLQLTTESFVMEKFRLNEWDNYIFYILSLEEFTKRRFEIGEKIFLEIDERPIINRRDFKLVFEDWGINPNMNNSLVYEAFGILEFKMPDIEIDDLNVKLISLSNNRSCNNNIMNFVKVDKNCIRLSFEESIEKGIYYLTIKYKQKTVHKEQFILVNKNHIIDNFNMTYNIHNNYHSEIVIPKIDMYKIVPISINSIVTEDDNFYHIKPTNIAVAKFGLKAWGNIMPIEKIIRPIRWSIIGLESILHTENDNMGKEITKTVFDNNDIRLHIENHDYRYNILAYKISIVDNNTNEIITEIRKLKYGEQFNFLFNDIKDRLLKISNMTINLGVLTEDDLILYQHMILKVVRKIHILNFNTEKIGKKLKLSWNEKEINKARTIKLYNCTTPWKKSIDFELQDDVTELEIELQEYDFGAYVPVVDYKKEVSMFENLIEKKVFLLRNDLNNIVINKYGNKDNKQSILMCKILWLYAKKNFNKVDKNLINVNLSQFEKDIAIYSIIQMKYFIDKDNVEQLKYFIKHSYYLLSEIIKNSSKDELINSLLMKKNEFNKNDFGLVLNMILAIDMTYISNDTIDQLCEIDIVNALCCVKNGSQNLTDNLITSCKESFDIELLGLVRKDSKLIYLMSNEIKVVNSFWEWLSDYKQRYIIKKNYSLSRAFRIYEFEKDISTLRIAGNNIDDLVEDIKCTESLTNIVLSKSWLNDLDINEDKNNLINQMLDNPMDKSYKKVLKIALYSIIKPEFISNKEYFNMIILSYCSPKWRLLERYRAFLKLIFI